MGSLLFGKQATAQKVTMFLVMFLLLAFSVSAQNFDNAVHDWEFNNDYNDSVDDITGSPQGSPVFSPGILNQAVNISGVGDFVDFAGTVDDGMNTSAGYGVTSWGNADSFAGVNQLVNCEGGTNFFKIFENAGSITFRFYDGGGGVNDITVGTPSTNAYHFYAMTWTGGTGRAVAWLDNSQVGNISVTTTATSGGCSIGARNGLNDQEWVGAVDQTIFDDVRLTDEIVAGRWNGGAGLEITPTPVGESNLTISSKSFTDNSSVNFTAEVEGEGNFSGEGTINTGILLNSTISFNITIWNATQGAITYFNRSFENSSHSNSSFTLNTTVYEETLTLLSPDNNTLTNIDVPFNYSYIRNGNELLLSCFLFDNRSGSFIIRASQPNVLPNITNSFTNTNITDFEGNFTWNIVCGNATSPVNRSITIDTTDPSITSTTPNANNQTKAFTNFSLNITVIDANNLETIVNITDPDGFLAFAETFNTSGFNIFNITNTTNNTIAGTYTLFIKSADGHTKNIIGNIPNSITNKEINFNNKVKIYPQDKTTFKEVSTLKRTDRYNLKFTRNKLTPYDIFIVEGKNIDIVEDSNYKGHVIIKDGAMEDWYWLDFETAENYPVYIERINENKVKVTVFGDNKDYTFNSIGEVNVINQTITYFYNGTNITLSESFDANIVDDFTTELLLNITFNDLIYNTSLKDPSAILEWNNTNFTGNLLSFTSQTARFNFTIFVNVTSGAVPVNITHQWYVNLTLTNGTEVTLNTDDQNQTVYPVLISTCTGTTIYPIINFTYFDEINGTPLNITNGYDLSITDGTFFYNQTAAFTGNHADQLCTNLPPSIVNYNWNMWGTLTLSEPEYATRIYTIEEAFPTLISNNPITNLELFLILLNTSTTMEYDWLTTQYELIDGTMRIFRCNANGTFSLIESTPITTGQAVANIEFLTASYKYDVIIDGELFEDPSFSTCHVEASTPRTFFVDVIPDELSPVVGMFLIGCELFKESAQVVNMTWTDNPLNASQIEGCTVGYTSVLGTVSEVFRDCSNSSSNSFLSTIPTGLGIMSVSGEVIQGTNRGVCENVLSFGEERSVGATLGNTGLLIAALFIMAMALFFTTAVESTEAKVVATVVALIMVWVWGIVNLDWVILSSAIAFSLVALYVARRGARDEK